jgi:hypothetical protein
MTVTTKKNPNYNRITVVWNHGFKHDFMCLGNQLEGELRSAQSLNYVKEVYSVEVTKAEYESYGKDILWDAEPTKKNTKRAARENSNIKKSGPQFSSLDTFFTNSDSPNKKSRRSSK